MEELRQQEGVIKSKQERVRENKQDDTAEAQVRQHLCVMQKCGLEPRIGKQLYRHKERPRAQDKAQRRD